MTEKQSISKRERIFTIIEVGNDSDLPSRTYDLTLMAAVILTILLAILETFESFQKYDSIMNVIEAILIAFLTVDYLLRIWTADFLYPRESTKAKARIRFIFSLQGIIDFLSCVPFFLPFGGGVLRILRIVRILRVFRIQRYADPLMVIAEVLKRKKGQLLSSVFIVFVLMLSASIVMYHLEHDAQPEVFSNALSGMWWACSALLTVGYGDMVPVTVCGKICAMVITFLGVGMVAIPTGIISAGFVEQVSDLKRENANELAAVNEEITVKPSVKYCPYCGEKIDL